MHACILSRIAHVLMVTCFAITAVMLLNQAVKPCTHQGPQTSLGLLTSLVGTVAVRLCVHTKISLAQLP